MEEKAVYTTGAKEYLLEPITIEKLLKIVAELDSKPYVSAFRMNSVTRPQFMRMLYKAGVRESNLLVSLPDVIPIVMYEYLPNDIVLLIDQHDNPMEMWQFKEDGSMYILDLKIPPLEMKPMDIEYEVGFYNTKPEIKFR